ncbi:MAG: NAD(P)/FAD-dependent oxidoreductase [Gammaproteobacteria bacterium]|nr:NAD(P)/FAD-dependent oxidoreductase [Gammaproteobacteria bacterium]
MAAAKKSTKASTKTSTKTSTKASANTVPANTAAAWLQKFGAALAAGDGAKIAAFFHEESYWRDLVAFTWNIKTAEGRDAVTRMAEATGPNAAAAAFQVDEAAGGASETDGITEAWFVFETATGRGRGLLRLRDGKCWTLLTTLAELKGFEEKDGRHGTRENGVAHGVHRARPTWLERKRAEEAALGAERQPYCVIIGGGQGGIGLGARLKRLGVPTLIVEKNPRPGDSWRNRYRSLCLHDPVWYDHMPYLPFPDHWPVFSPKDKIGDWLEMYVKVMELNYWASTRCLGAEYDADAGEWRVTVQRGGGSGNGGGDGNGNGGGTGDGASDGRDTVVLRPKQLVLATGMSGVPNMPALPGADEFRGVLCHSSAHRGGDGWGGKNCVVIGSNNSAHDICAELWEQGAEVTMVQRSSTHVAKSETLMEFALGDLYSERAVAAGVTTDKADLIFASVPYKIMHAFHIPVYEKIAARDKQLYDALEAAGFMLDFGEDGSGLFMKYLRRGSGYYIDVGASQLIADGAIKLRSGVEVERLTAGEVVLSDGTKLPADLIVCATGYGSMNGWAAQLISQQVADKVGKCWGLGSDTRKDPGPWEGELRNMWKPTRQEALWFHGGNLHQSRHYSQFLALQLKARQENLPTPVYELAPSHHRR